MIVTGNTSIFESSERRIKKQSAIRDASRLPVDEFIDRRQCIQMLLQSSIGDKGDDSSHRIDATPEDATVSLAPPVHRITPLKGYPEPILRPHRPPELDKCCGTLISSNRISGQRQGVIATMASKSRPNSCQTMRC